jgi:hypothetical protein
VTDLSMVNPGPITFHYRNQDILKHLAKIRGQWWRRKKTKKLLLDVEMEMSIMHGRIQYMAVEISEWRYKIGGNYSTQRLMGVVQDGIRNRVGEWIRICDDDFKGKA